jgi:hypothetical protein
VCEAHIVSCVLAPFYPESSSCVSHQDHGVYRGAVSLKRSRVKPVLAIKSTARSSHQEFYPLLRIGTPSLPHGLISFGCEPRAFLDLVSFPSDYSHFGTTFAAAFAAHCFCCCHCGTATDSAPKVRAPACRSVRASANDKIENEEVAPRVTPVAAARRSRPYPRAHPLLRIGDPSPYAPSPALPSVDPTVLRSCGVSIRRSYPLSSTSLNTVPKR